MKKRNLKSIFADDPEVLALLKSRSAEDMSPLMEGLQYLFQGKPGLTPEKGKDYFTEEEKQEFLESVTPQKFKDYFTKEEIKSVMSDVFDAVVSELKSGLKEELTPKKGVDYRDGIDGQDAIFDEKKAIDSILKAIPKVKELNPDEIVSKVKDELKTLIPSVEDFIKEVKEKRLIELRDIKGARLDNPRGNYSMDDQRWHGGGLQNITGLISAGTNVTITGTGTSTDPYVINSSGGAGGIASINADTTSAQLLVVGTAGTDFAIVDNGTGTHTFNLPTASATNRGALSSADWTTFNNKGSGTVTSVSGTANRITSTGGATPVIDISASYVGQTSITTLGTITTGVWNGTDVAVTAGGTGVSAISALSVWVANSANTITEVTPGAGNSIRINAGGTAWEAYTPAAGATPGGSDTQIQFNDSGAFGGDSGLTFNKTSNVTTMVGVGSGQVGTLNITRGDSVNQYIVLTESASSAGSAYLTFAGSSPGAMAMGALYTAGVPTSYVFTDTGGTPLLSIDEATGDTDIVGDVSAVALALSATSNQIVLQSAGVTGTLTWTPTSSNKTITFPDATGTVALTSGVPTIGGSDTQVQFNDGGVFGGDADFTWNKTTNVLTVPNVASLTDFVLSAGVNGDAGGSISLLGGDATGGNANGGSLTAIGGEGDGAGDGGLMDFVGGTGGATGAGGNIVFTGGFGGGTSGNGGSVSFKGGEAPTSGNGGDITFFAGIPAGAGTPGRFLFTEDQAIFGILDFGSLATSDKTFTFPNASGTIALTSDIPAAGANTALSNLASVAINTTLVSDTTNTDDIGTSSVLWRTGYFGTSIELGHATQNTLTASGGVLSIEGVAIPTISSTSTLTNKRPQPRTASSTTAATLTPDLSSASDYYRTTQTEALTIGAPTGTPVIGEVITIMVDSAGAQTLTMNATYIPFGAAFPATTTAGKTLMITAKFNGTNWKTLWAVAV